MKFLVLFGVIAVVFSAPVPEEEPKEFELQQVSDVDGSYTFTFSTADQSRTESRTPEGVLRGAYSYIDSDGVLQKVQYLADENGFQAYGTNLPVGSTVPVKETPEVLEATADHFARVDEHLKKVALAEKLHEEFKRLHPELFEDVPVTKRVVVHHVTPVTKKVVVHHVTPVTKTVKPVVHHVTPVVKKVAVVHHAAPVQKLPVVHHVTPVVKKVPVVHHVEHVKHVEHGLPVVPDEDEEVKIARKFHLDLVEKLTAQHLAALAAAPKVEE